MSVAAAAAAAAARKTKKRQYSRNGCSECKRRKLKCDEGKPDCWQCSHLGKKCEYLKVIKFSASRTITAPKTKETVPRRSNIVHIINNNSEAKEQQEEGKDIPAPPPKNNYKPITKNPQDDIIQDASLLANDIIESINSELDDFIMDLTLSESFKKQNVIDSFGLQEPHKHHLEVFYDKISSWIMPLDQSLCNDILVYHAKTSPSLLAAMLSLSTIDEAEKNKYITTCLRSLSNVFQSDQTNILNNIEPLILTVLLLAADSTSGNWRAHLRGAKDLFIKFIKVSQTPSLLLAKSWFATIEILAVLQSVGTVKEEEELDELLDVGLYGSSAELAVECGLLLKNGFNIFLGYSSEGIIMYREWCKLVKNEITNDKLLFQMSLIHSAKEFQVASSEVLITRENPAHPNYEGIETKQVLPSSCYGFTGSGIVFSWFDLLHQLHVDALLLKIYNEVMGLDKSQKLVQQLIKQMLSLCYFFQDDGEVTNPSDPRLMMLQGPMLSCGLNAIDVDDKIKIEKYFECLMKLGIKSAPVSWETVRSYWDGNMVAKGQDLVTFA